MHFSLLIFQHTEHFSPSAFVVTAITSFVSFFSIFALDVMHNSAKLVFSVILNNFSFKLIIKFASRLDPISLLALLASMLILQIFLIFLILTIFHLISYFQTFLEI